MEEDKDRAIKNIEKDIELSKEGEGFYTEVLCNKEDLENLLTRYKQQQAELEKKEAIINEMSKFIANLKLSWFKKEDGGEFLGKYRFYNQEEWIEYFTNKVEREGK